MNKSLSELRDDINAIDLQLVMLLNSRASVAVQIGAVKATEGQAVYNPTREGQVINRVAEANQGPLPKGSIEEIFNAIISACRQIQMVEPQAD
jgi:chorismate mutase/prephenate dehydratase